MFVLPYCQIVHSQHFLLLTDHVIIFKVHIYMIIVSPVCKAQSHGSTVRTLHTVLTNPFSSNTGHLLRFSSVFTTDI